MGSYCLMDTKFYVGDDENVLGIDSSDGCAILRRYLFVFFFCV